MANCCSVRIAEVRTGPDYRHGTIIKHRQYAESHHQLSLGGVVWANPRSKGLLHRDTFVSLTSAMFEVKVWRVKGALFELSLIH